MNEEKKEPAREIKKSAAARKQERAEERNKPFTIVGEKFVDDPNFVDDGIAPWD